MEIAMKILIKILALFLLPWTLYAADISTQEALQKAKLHIHNLEIAATETRTRISNLEEMVLQERIKINTIEIKNEEYEKLEAEKERLEAAVNVANGHISSLETMVADTTSKIRGLEAERKMQATALEKAAVYSKNLAEEKAQLIASIHQDAGVHMLRTMAIQAKIRARNLIADNDKISIKNEALEAEVKQANKITAEVTECMTKYYLETHHSALLQEVGEDDGMEDLYNFRAYFMERIDWTKNLASFSQYSLTQQGCIQSAMSKEVQLFCERKGYPYLAHKLPQSWQLSFFKRMLHPSKLMLR